MPSFIVEAQKIAKDILKSLYYIKCKIEIKVIYMIEVLYHIYPLAQMWKMWLWSLSCFFRRIYEDPVYPLIMLSCFILSMQRGDKNSQWLQNLTIFSEAQHYKLFSMEPYFTSPSVPTRTRLSLNLN